MSETVTSQTSDYVAHQRAIRALELKLESLNMGWRCRATKTRSQRLKLRESTSVV
jgi:hypothetical protein